MDRCGVPGCGRPKGPLDCCDKHSERRQGPYQPNDGVIDHVAIDLVAEGVRIVRLTWVEAEIAVAKMLAKGLGVSEAYRRLGFEFSSVGRQRAEVNEIAIALLNQEGVRA